MILRNLAFAIRNIRRNKLLAAINVLGLSIGITACLVIFLIASYEMGYDRFQPDGDRIYRVYTTFSGSFSGINRGVSTGIPVAIRENFTGVEAITNFHTFGAEVEVVDEGNAPKDFGKYQKVIIADPEYFQVFNYYQWVVGSPEQSLREPFRVVLSERRARTYFGDTDLLAVIGKEIHYQDSLVVTVSGIVKDITERTDLDFTDFISFSTIEKSWLNENRIQLDNWNSTNSSSQVFLKLNAGISKDEIDAQMSRLSEIYEAHNKGSKWTNTPTLQPLSDVHFNPEVGIFDSSRSVVDRSTLQILILVAALLLIIAFINFVNLETAQASRRAREVGVRKVLGSSRRLLILGFLTETFVLCLLAVTLSVFSAALSLKYFSSYIPEGLVFDVTDPVVILFLVGCVCIVPLMAGLYPAFILSSYRPAVALKNMAGAGSGSSRSALVRKSLTVFQFSFSQVLIAGTIAVSLQLHYMLNKDLGFSTDSVVFISTPWHEEMGKRLALRNELRRIPEIELLSMHGSPPLSGGYSSRIMEFDNGKEILNHNVYLKYGDTSYIRLYGIELLAGRNLVPMDTSREYLINETYMHELGFSEARDIVGQTVNKDFTIVGVVKDFHAQSLHSEIEPTAIVYDANESGIGVKMLTARNKVADLQPGLEKIESAWKKIYPDHEFRYTFLSESVKRFYETEQRTGRLVRIATGIAILISCLGLFGLSTFTVVQRTKEIGIRKVLGASVRSILFLLSRDFLKLLIIAFILSTPVAYLLVERWLQGFAYRTDFGAWIFVASGLASLIVAFITISFRTVRAAKTDPVKSLRYE